MSMQQNGAINANPDAPTPTSVLTSTAEQVKGVLADIFVVLEKADAKTAILEVPIHEGFTLKNPAQIVQEYSKYVESGQSKSQKSIKEKFAANGYLLFYSLYEDIKLASATSIITYKTGTEKYKNIDFFYRFSCELLLRETLRLKLAELVSKREQEFKSELLVKTDLEATLDDDFHKISSTLFVENGEVVSIIHEIDAPSQRELNPYASLLYLDQYNNNNEEEEKKKIKQPLYTSLTRKSQLDPRPTIVPEPFNLTKVVPSGSFSSKDGYTLNSINPHTSKIPLPGALIPEIMLNFFHPNWYTLAVPTWLGYRTLRPESSESEQKLISSKIKQDGATSTIKVSDANVASLGPTFDLTTAILSEEQKSSIWMQHIGYEEINRLRKEYLKSTNGHIDTDTVSGEIGDENSDGDIDELDEKKDVEGVEEKVEGEQDLEEDEEEEEDPEDDMQVDLNDLAEWDPVKIAVVQDLNADKEIITKSTESFQKLISSDIVKLNKLRQERYLRSNVNLILEPSETEIRLYHKILRMITLFIDSNNLTTADIPVKFSSRLPILLKEYAGTLPAVKGVKPVVASTYVNNGRLPSVRGPYKKKNRIY